MATMMIPNVSLLFQALEVQMMEFFLRSGWNRHDDRESLVEDLAFLVARCLRFPGQMRDCWRMTCAATVARRSDCADEVRFYEEVFSRSREVMQQVARVRLDDLTSAIREMG